MYVGKKDSNLIRPVRELKGFVKVALKPGEVKQVKIDFDDKTFRFWDVQTNSWQVEPGEYQVMVGANVNDIKLSGQLTEQGTVQVKADPRLQTYRDCQLAKVSDEDFAALLGQPLPRNDFQPGQKLQHNDTLGELRYARGWLGRRIGHVLANRLAKSQAAGKPDLNILFLYNMPFRAIAKMTGGQVDLRMVDDILDGVNGRFWHGLGHLVHDFFSNRSRQKHVKF